MTSTGDYFDFLNMSPNNVHIQDIAHALARQCRYAGHCLRFYSVAQHSVIASHIVPRKFALEALLHDAHEAYVGDMTMPLKQLLPDFMEIEHKVDAVIRQKFSLPNTISQLVKYADRIMLATEERDLLIGHARWEYTKDVLPLHKKIEPERPVIAECNFLARFDELTKPALS